MSVPACTRLSSTAITLLLMLIYWWFFSDFLNILTLVSGKELACSSLDDSTRGCSSDRGASDGESWQLSDTLTAVDDVESQMNQGWSVGSVLRLVLVVMSMVVGLCSAAVLGSLLAIAVFLKSGKKYQLSTIIPPRLQALYTVKKVSYINSIVFFS